MADPTKNIITSDPIQTLEKASKISLRSGTILLVAAGVAIFGVNTWKWQVDGRLTWTLLIGAILLGVLDVLARMYDARLRADLVKEDMRTNNGTTKAERDAAAARSKALNELLGNEKGLVLYAVNPPPPGNAGGKTDTDDVEDTPTTGGKTKR